MKLISFGAVLCLLASSAFALTITQAEYYINSDPGIGLATPIAITPGENVSISGLMVPSTGLAATQVHKLYLRYRGSEGYWSMADSRYFYIIAATSGAVTYHNVVQAQYWFDNLAPTTIDIPDAPNMSYAALVPTTGLAVGNVHTFNTRFQDDRGIWSMPVAKYFWIIQSTGGTVEIYPITHLEYWFDAQPATQLDITDSTSVSFADLIPVNLSQGLHLFNLRYQDSRGIWSMPVAKYFWIIQSTGGTAEIHPITHLEYWFDALPATQLDITDGTTVSFAGLIPVNLLQGLHRFNIRYRDDRGIWSMADTRNFVLIFAVPPSSSPSNLAAAEYFINADPSPGNGVPIPLPVDGAWDERNEDVAVTITGVPIGLHRFSIRYRDDQGHWSMAFNDTVVVTPVLVVRRSGNDILLSWQADPAHVPFHVYRSDVPNAGFVELAQTDNLNYSDAGAVTAFNKKFYYVTTTPSALSAFRLPALSETPQVSN